MTPQSIFTFSEDEEKEYGYVDGYHADGGLPGVTCQTCGVMWSTNGFAYPGVDISVFEDYKNLFKPGNVSVERYKELRKIVEPLLPSGSHIPPGTSFGTLMGDAIGDLQAFAKCDGAFMIQRDVYDDMVTCGLQMPRAFPARLFFLEGMPKVEMLEPYGSG